MKEKKTNQALIPTGSMGHEYELKENENSVWITINNLSIYIKRNDKKVSIEVYEKGKETEKTIASTYAMFDEALSIKEAKCLTNLYKFLNI